MCAALANFFFSQGVLLQCLFLIFNLLFAEVQPQPPAQFLIILSRNTLEKHCVTTQFMAAKQTVVQSHPFL